MRMLLVLRRALWAQTERGPWFALLMTAAFGAAQVFGHRDHELWKDELHCYGVGRSASGLFDLLTGERRYEGHPFMWYLLLHLASRVHRDWISLPVVSTAVATLAGYVWLRYARVPRLLRVALLGSYYLLYEYGVLSRSYTLGMLLVFVFCALYHPLRIRYVASGFVLFLIAATSLYGTLIAGMLALFLFTHDVRWIAPDARDDRGRIALPLGWAAGLLVFGAGLALTALTTIPPGDSMYAPGWSFDFSFETLKTDFANYWGAMLPFHNLTEWNWLFIDYLGSTWGLAPGWIAAFGFAYFLGWLWSLRKVPVLAGAYALGVFAMMAVQHGIYPAALRHRGHYFILLLACLWLHEVERRGRARAYLAYGLLGATLCVQIATGVAAMRTDHNVVFSDAQHAAKFLRDNNLQHVAIIGSTDHASSPIAIMLDTPFLFQETGETHQVVLEHNRRQPPNPMLIMSMAVELLTRTDRVLLLLNYDNPSLVPPGYELKLLYRGQPALMYDESYRIYELKRSAPPPPQAALEAPPAAATPPAAPAHAVN